jgi:hypothetical protein
MNPHQTRLDAEKETFDPALTAKADICRIPRAITPRKQCKGVLTYERRNQLLADPISAPPRRRPVGTKTAKNPSGGKGRRGLGQRTPGSGILDRAVLALERMKENGKGKKERWRLYLTRRKRWGVERLKRGGGKEGSWHGEGGRATTVARDSGSSGGGGTAGGRQRGVRGSCFVWVSGCWFRRFCVPPKLIFFHSILY